MKWALKHFAQDAVYRSRFLLASDDSAARKLIVVYHGVTRGPLHQYNGRHMPVHLFEASLQFFRKYFDVAPLRRLLDPDFLPKQKTIAISFDDGYLNNFEVALPLLQQYKMPATFFVTTAPLQDENFIHPACAVDLLRCVSTSNELTLSGKKFTKAGAHRLQAADGQSAYEYLIGMSLTERNGLMRELYDRGLQHWKVAVPPLLWRCMNQQQLQTLVSTKEMDVQTHTHTHMNLNKLSAEELKQEVKTSIALLEASIQRPVDILAPPYVRVSDEVGETIRDYGVNFVMAGINADVSKHFFPRITLMSSASRWFNFYYITTGFAHLGF